MNDNGFEAAVEADVASAEKLSSTEAIKAFYERQKAAIYLSSTTINHLGMMSPELFRDVLHDRVDNALVKVLLAVGLSYIQDQVELKINSIGEDESDPWPTTVLQPSPALAQTQKEE